VFAKFLGTLLFLCHAAAVVAAVAGPVLVLADTLNRDGHITFAAWRSAFSDLPRWSTLLGNTAVVAGVAALACIPAGIVLAVALFRTDLRFRLAGIVLLLLTAAIPLFIVSGAVFSIIGKDRWLGMAPVVGLVHAVVHLPIVTLIVGAALRSVSADTEEAALVEGAGPVRTLFSVTLPMAIGGIVASLVVVMLWVTTDYSVSDLVVVRTFAEEVYTLYAVRPHEAALVCVPQIVLFGGLLWYLRSGFLAGCEGEETQVASEEPYRFRVRRHRRLLSVVTATVVLALAATPVATLFARLCDARSLRRYAWLFTGEIQTSIWTSFSAAVLVAVLGLGLAWYAVRRPRWRPVIAAFVVLMLAIPAPVLGMGLIAVFNRDGPLGYVYGSPGMLVLAYTFRFLPVAVILLIPAVRAIPLECELSAKVDGCGGVATWWHIVWPLCLPQALLVVFAVAALSFGELPCSLLVTPPGYDTVGKRFFDLIHMGLYPDVAVLGLWSVAAVLVPWAGITWLLRRRLLR